MPTIIYGQSITEKKEPGIGEERLRETFAGAAAILRKLEEAGKRVACFFIDPLLDYFEAGNRFYFRVLGCRAITRMNWYRTGAGPVCALADARDLINRDGADAVFIFGYEPLLSDRNSKGKAAVQQAMDIFSGVSLLACYNALGQALCDAYGLTDDEFSGLADALFDNYRRTWSRNTGNKRAIPARGKNMAAAGAPLFKLTDCANPNLDFAAGIIVCNRAATDYLRVPPEERVRVAAAGYAVVEANPTGLSAIAGTRERPFPHLKAVFSDLCHAAQMDPAAALRDGSLLLDAYTCYPPIPMGFLLACGFIQDIRELPDFLERHEITVDGGLNLFGAPWNNPVLGSFVAMRERLAERGGYGLVHGNGGMGEAQGLVLLHK